MGERAFHDPDLSWGVFRRRVGDEILSMLDGYLEVLATRGRSLTWNHSFPDRQQYNAAVRRLRKEGLIAGGGNLQHAPHLALTEAGERRVRPELRPEGYWNRRWGGTWYLLTYDVPERERRYRDALRGFLVRMRMGCLQRSVWVSHRDVRPEFADLRDAAAIEEYAFLLEAQTLLGLAPWRLAAQAWSFDRIEADQQAYCDYARDKLTCLASGTLAPGMVQTLAREEMTAYGTAMQRDPLLPSALHPPDYLGREVWRLHRQLVAEIGSRL